jgi:hypothetical protein
MKYKNFLTFLSFDKKERNNQLQTTSPPNDKVSSQDQNLCVARSLAFKEDLLFTPVNSVRYTDAVADSSKARWYRLTPDRFIIGLLAAEGLLWLSEQFKWFSINQHKGWTVLLSIAAVGVAMLVMLLWFIAGLIFRCWFQISIRSLLVLTVVVALPFSRLAVEMRLAKKQKADVEAFAKIGGYVFYDWERVDKEPIPPVLEPREPAWLRNLLGSHFFDIVFEAGVNDDAQLESLKAFSQLKSLCLYLPAHHDRFDRFHVTDGGLAQISELTQLEALCLPCSQITDQGLSHLATLPRLRGLDVTGTGITDAGLPHLERLIQLQYLTLNGTQITDIGLHRLEGMTQLRFLDLVDVKVTDEGVKKLQQALPNCEIRHWND